jgi:hypothetical protein
MKWGKADNGNQRFKCRTCKSTISTTTNTVVYRLRHRDKWSKFMGLMSSHMSVAGLIENHFPGMSENTMLRWRHRIMSAFLANQNGLTGIVQADEKFFRLSFKGNARAVEKSGRKARKRGGSQYRGISREQVAVLTAVDSNGNINQEMIGNRIQASVIDTLTPWVSVDTVLMTDGYAGYEKVAKNIGCEHIISKSKSGQVARLNAYHTGIENLVNRKCLGVATKHLMKYFAWMRHLTMRQPFGDGMLEMVLA